MENQFQPNFAKAEAAIKVVPVKIRPIAKSLAKSRPTELDWGAGLEAKNMGKLLLRAKT